VIAFCKWSTESLANALKAPKRPAHIAELKRPDLPSAPLSTIEPAADFVLKLPLIAEITENYTYQDRTIIRREPGEPLNPKRVSVAEIEAQKARIAQHVFALSTGSAPRPAAQDIVRSNTWRVMWRRRPSS
jgi:hypothetical protein